MVVRIRNFSRTLFVLESRELANDIDNLIHEVTTEVDAFVSTLALNNICDIRTKLTAGGKYSRIATYEALVYYLE